MKNEYSSWMSEISSGRGLECDFFKKEIYPMQNIFTE